MTLYSVERWSRPDSPDPDELHRLMETEGYSVYRWTDRAGALYPPHEHPSDQSHWIISGTLELNVDGVGVVTLAQGDRDFMPAGTVHSARVLGSEPVAYLIGERNR
jgi:quercetin dioxygenase-like cupin family protein